MNLVSSYSIYFSKITIPSFVMKIFHTTQKQTNCSVGTPNSRSSASIHSKVDISGSSLEWLAPRGRPRPHLEPLITTTRVRWNYGLRARQAERLDCDVPLKRWARRPMKCELQCSWIYSFRFKVRIYSSIYILVYAVQWYSLNSFIVKLNVWVII